MVSFQFTRSASSQGTTFVFGSWVCIADDAGSFRCFLVNMKPKTSAAGPNSDLDKFIDDLDDLSNHSSATKPRWSLLLARLHPAERQPSSGWTRSNLRTRITGHDSVNATWPLIFRRPTAPSPSPYWRRTWILFSRSQKPPHVGGLWVVSVPTV
jgi:hypothetical protein